MTLLDDFRRVSQACPCPVCEHPDWCMISKDDPPSRVICQRVESKHRWKDAGWLHMLRECNQHHAQRPRKIVIPARVTLRDFGDLADEYRRQSDPEAVARLADHLGVTSLSLERLGLGWDGRNWTFPMSDATGLVRGIRLRTPGGRKFAVTGSKQGLFIPTDLSGRGPLLLTEGPTDTAATLDLGFNAVGRPSCRGGTRLVVEYLKASHPSSVVIVADSDVAGRGGADDLASVLACYCPEVRVIEPPTKDLREWLRSGASPADVNDTIERARSVRVGVTRRGGVG